MPRSQPWPLEEATRQHPGLVAIDGRVYPLRTAALRARAQGGAASTVLVQEFANPHAEPLEVIYTLPLPADGAVVGYTIRLGERVITGEIEKREAALEAYRKALEEGRTAGLLEQERAETFTQTLGSLPPGVPVRVEIEVLHPLGFRLEAGEAGPRWEYRFPTVVGVRYEGAPGRVADAGKLDVDRVGGEGTPVRLAVDLHIGDGGPEALQVQSPSCALAVTAAGAATTVAPVEPLRLDRDVVIRWCAAHEKVGISLVEGAGLPGDPGRYALVTLTPPQAPQCTLARDVTLLIDASGSMEGKPIAQAKEVAVAVLRSLAPCDRFEVLAFASRVQRLGGEREVATEKAVRAAISEIGRLAARGGTEMRQAISEALADLRPDSQRQVILITDGYIGFEQQIVAELLRGLPGGARVHVVGIGAAPNRALTRGASRAGRGTEHLIGIGEDAGQAAERLIRATAAPVLTGIEIEGDAVVGVAPARLLDVFAGQPLRAAVELRPEGGALVVRGRLAGSDEPWVERVSVPRAGSREMVSDGLPLGALYGRERVEDLEMQLAAAGFDQGSALLSRIEVVGLQHRIVTRRTSMVAISEDLTVDPRDPRRRERLAVEMPADVSAEAVGLALPVARVALSAPRSRVWFRSDLEAFGSPMRVDRETIRKLERNALERLGRHLHGRVIRFDGEQLVVEFETDGSAELPPDGAAVTVRFDDGPEWTGSVVGKGSTRSGQHDRGLTVRLELRLPVRPFREQRVPCLLAWTEPQHCIVRLYV